MSTETMIPPTALSIPWLWRLAGEGIALTYRSAPDYEARLTQHTALVLSGESVADFNYVVIDAHPQAETRLREYVEVIHRRNLPVVVILSEAVAQKLASVAGELGLQDAGKIPLMVYRPEGADVQGQEPNDLCQFEHIQSAPEVEVTTAIMCKAFGLPEESGQRAFNANLLEGPGVELFLARQNGIAVSALMTTRAGVSIGIWAMATHPDHQRRGVGYALLNHVMAHYAARGATLYYLLATDAGKPLYERIGFETVTEGVVWVAGHSTQVSGH